MKSLAVLVSAVVSALAALAAVALIATPVPSRAEAPAATLRGRVLLPGGTPLAKAGVLLVPADDPVATARQILAGAGVRDRARARALTDGSGSYTFADVGPGTYTVRIVAEGFAPLQSPTLTVVDDVDLQDAVLDADSGLRVRVEVDGKPGAGVLVQARPHESTARVANTGWYLAAQQVVTSPDGSARLGCGAMDRLDVFVGARGRAFVEWRALRGGKAVLAIALPAGDLVPLVVHTADGSPAGGVLLRGGDTSSLLGVTDDAGRFEFRLLPGTEQRITALHAGGAVAETRVSSRVGVDVNGGVGVGGGAEARDQAPVVLTLSRLATIKGRVVDASTREPVARAVVQGRRPVTTGEDGRFELELPARGRHSLRTRARGYLEDQVEVVADVTGPVTVALVAASSLEGRVVDGDGLPVAGAEVSILPGEGASEDDRILRALTRGTRARLGDRGLTRADGSFRVTRIRPGSNYDIEVRAQGFATASRELPDLRPRVPVTGVTIELDRGFGASGVVVDAGGRPVSGAEVVFRPAASGADDPFQVVLQAPAATVVSSGDGRFAASGLAAAAYDVTASRPGFAPTTVKRVEFGAGKADAGRLVLEPGVTVDGVVVDAAGQPVPDVRISVDAADDRAAALHRTMTGAEPDAVTGPDGRFVVRDRRRGERVNVTAKREGYAEKTVPSIALPPDGPVKLALDASSRVSGRVLDPDGRPVAGALVSAGRERRAGSGVFAVAGARPVQTVDDGSFELVDLTPGGLALQVQSPGFQDQDVFGLDVVAGKDLAGIEVRLVPSAWVEGRVLLPDGRPAIEAKIEPVRNDPAGPRFSRTPLAWTDGDGRYRLDGLKPGQRSLEANSDGLPRVVRDVELRTGANVADFRFTGGQELAGRVLDPAGTPVARAAVELLRSGEGWTETRAVTGQGGEFAFHNVVDGEYRLLATRTGLAPSAAVAVKVAGAPVTDLELRLRQGTTITGAVLGVEPAQLPGVRVEANRDRGVELTAAPDAQGRYRLENAHPGRWWVTAEDRVGTSLQREITVAEGQAEVALDLDFSKGLTLTGRVLVGAEPLADAYVFASGRAFSKARTDSQGRFALRGLEPGRVELTVSEFRAGLNHRETLEITTSRDVVIRFPVRRVQGRVLDAATKSPVAGVSVVLSRTNAPEHSVYLRPTVTVDAAGRFEIANVAPGTYRVDGRKAGYAAREQTLTVSEGRDVTGLEVLLDATEGLTLVVLGLDGRPVNGDVSVAVLDGTGHSVAGGRLSTGEGGRLRIEGVPPGTWTVLASADGSATTTATATAPGTAQSLVLEPACTLEVRVPSFDDEVQGLPVTVTGADGREFHSVGWGGDARRVAYHLVRGRLRIDDLPPGTWHVRVSAPGGRTLSATAQLRPGAAVVVEPE